MARRLTDGEWEELHYDIKKFMRKTVRSVDAANKFLANNCGRQLYIEAFYMLEGFLVYWGLDYGSEDFECAMDVTDISGYIDEYRDSMTPEEVER